jgi:hypothetical protein
VNSGRRFALVAFSALAALVSAGCAKREPPSGGPPDLEPPRVISSFPDSGAAGVPPDAHLSLTFSEGMEPRSTGDAVALAPRVEIRQRRWSGRTLTVVLAEPLKVPQTYTLFLGSNATDRHGNRIENGRTLVFSTADSFPRGVIAGEIEPRGFAAGGIYLWGYSGERKPDSTARDFDALGVTDVNGQFRVAGLSVPGRYRLWAFADLNFNRSFEPQIDVLAPVDTVFDLSGSHPQASGIHVIVVNPRAPGRVRGAVLDSLADTLGVVRVTAAARSDSTRTLLFDVDAERLFDLRLAPGTWRIRAFRDLDKSRSWQSALEPASDMLELVVPPAGDVVGVKLMLKRPPGRAEHP